MSPKEKVILPNRAWTRADAYVDALVRNHRSRGARRERRRTQPDKPRFMLSTLPFVALLALLAVLGVAIMIMAYPGNQPSPKPPHAAPKEKGIAERGWFQDAQKEMHH